MPPAAVVCSEPRILGSMTEQQDVVERICQLAACAGVFSKADSQEAMSLTEQLKQFLSVHAAEFVSEAAGQPCLLQYSLDCTRVVVQHTTAIHSKALSVKRAGKQSLGWLVQQVYLTRIVADGSFVHHIIIRDPVSLQYGKSKASLLGCALQCPGLDILSRCSGQINILHQVHDQGITGSFVTGLSGHWHRQERSHASPTTSSSSADAGALFAAASPEDFHWHTHVPCCAHIAHNALRWAHQSTHGDKNLMEAIYIGVTAMRQCYALASQQLGQWLLTTLLPTSVEHLPDPDFLETLWSTLGVDEDVKHELSHVLRLKWDGSHLQIDEAVMQGAEWLQQVSTALLGLWKFRGFTASRWATVGMSCRGVLAACLSGYFLFAQHLQQVGVLNEYHSHGLDRLEPRVLKSVAAMGLSAKISETFLVALLKDSRVAPQVQHLQTLLLEEFQSAIVLPDGLWEELASTYGGSGSSLRHEVLASLHIQWAFLDEQVLQLASGLPWSLCGANGREVFMDLLQATSPPQEAVAASMVSLAEAGYPPSVLRQALDLLAQCSWTSASTERQHASVATVARMHPELGANLLACRAYLHSCRQLLPSSSAEQKRLARVHSQLASQSNKEVNRITGRHVLVSDALAKAKAKNAMRGQHQSKYSAQKVVQAHGKQLSSLSHVQKTAFEKRAALKRSEASTQQQQRVHQLQQQADLLKRKIAETQVREASGSMKMSSARLSDAGLRDLQHFVEDAQWAPKEVTRLRAHAMQCPKPVEEEEVHNALKGDSRLRPVPLEQRSPVYMDIAKMRSYFMGAVFFLTEAEPCWHRLLFATLTPARLYLQGSTSSLYMRPLTPTQRLWI